MSILKYSSKKMSPKSEYSVSTKTTLSTKAWPYIFATPFVLSYTLFSLFPTIYSFYISLFDWNGISDKVFVGLKNYIRIFTKDPLFYKSLWNTLLMMIMSTPIQLFLGLVIAAILFNMVKGKGFFQSAIFLPYITTAVAIGFIFSYLFDYNAGYVNLLLIKLGVLRDKYYWLQNPLAARMIVALMIIWRYLGYTVIIYIAGMTSISQEIYEAAKVDGSSTINTFFKITVPLLKNVSVFLIVTSIIGGLQMFDEPVMLYSGWGTQNVGGPDYSVLTVVWKFYDDAFKTNTFLGYGAAVSYVLFLFIIIFSLISYRVSAGKEE